MLIFSASELQIPMSKAANNAQRSPPLGRGICFSHTEITEITEKVLFIEEGGICFARTEITENTENF
jgi:hypothetical protein